MYVRRVDLARFHRAQAQPFAGYDTAIAELRAGRKDSHWIWYVFPQLGGLGSSSQSQRYGLADLDEAVAYLEDPILGSRLVEATTAVAEQIRNGTSLSILMASTVDVLKLVSSLTLFEAAAARLYEREGLEIYSAFAAVADEVLMAAFAEGHPRCQFTLSRLRT